jgi:TolB-like protein
VATPKLPYVGPQRSAAVWGHIAPMETLRVGDVLLDLGAGCLRGDDGAEIALRPKAFDLLAVLVHNPRRTLSRDELLDAVWPGVTVTEESVTQCVREVRRAIGDPDGHLLRTVARRGYRLDLGVVPVTPADDRVTAALTSAEPSVPSPITAVARLDKPSIAVLPFQNISGDPEQEYFVDGMVEEIITALSRIRWLFVIARNSSFTYKGQAVDVKQVGRELGVRYVLEGSVRKARQRVRIAGQLIDATTGAHLWADRFDGSLEDVFELQDKVAASVAGVIEPALQAAETARSAGRPTTDLTAYDLYLRAHAIIWSSAEGLMRRFASWSRRSHAIALRSRPRRGRTLLSAADNRRSEQGSGGGSSKGRRLRPKSPRSGRGRPVYPGERRQPAGLLR